MPRYSASLCLNLPVQAQQSGVSQLCPAVSTSSVAQTPGQRPVSPSTAQKEKPDGNGYVQGGKSGQRVYFEMVRISESRNSTRMKIWEWEKNDSIQRELFFSSDQLVSSLDR